MNDTKGVEMKKLIVTLNVEADDDKVDLVEKVFRSPLLKLHGVIALPAGIRVVDALAEFNPDEEDETT